MLCNFPLISSLRLTGLLVGIAFGLAGCGGSQTAESAMLPTTTLKLEAAPGQAGAGYAQLLAGDGFWPGAERLVADKRDGLLVLGAGGVVLSRLPGAFGSIDHRIGKESLLAAVIDVDRQQAAVASLAAAEKSWGSPQYLPRRDFKIEAVCLYRDESHDEYVFLVGEEGMGEQWLVARNEVPLKTALRVRSLSLPPQSEHCQADDAAGLLYVNEEDVGLWAYEAHPEAPLLRYPVDMKKPFGAMVGAVAGMAVVPGGLLALEADTPALHRYARVADGWQAQPAIRLEGIQEPERISARVSGQGLEVLVSGDHGARQARVDWLPAAVPNSKPLPVLPAQVQTDMVPSLGDAADDPAIWVNSHEPAHSRVLGTDKQGGLLVYDLHGKEVQRLDVGRLNNVDVRPGFEVDGETVDLAVATNRDSNSLHVFGIDRRSGDVRVLGQVPTPLREIYGFCMFKDAQGAIHAIPNDKDGTFLQYRLSAPQGKIAGELVRRFKVQSQPEGCVADDRRQQLFVGEERVAVWVVDARADVPAELKKVIETGDLLKADVEGLAIYHGEKADYLVVSSQGNDSYLVLDAAAPYAVRGAFRIGANAELGIDGVSETDGLDVTSANLGGPWSQGMLVVQDGRKRMPEGSQNFKYLPWSLVAQALSLE